VNLSQLETFLAVARSKSFTRAAEVVNLTQSAVSRQIQDLEESLGVQLFERLGRKISLTPAGTVLVEEATRLVQQAENLQQRLRDLGETAEGELRVGGSVTATNTFLPQLLARFRKRHPEVRLSLRPGYNRMLTSWLRNNELDVAVLGGSVERPDLAVECEVADELVVVGAAAHPLAERTRVPPQRLDRQDFVMRAKGAHSQLLADSWFETRGVRPNRVLELP
jgi:DNA-binding transcriptional LysR family regulator